jgi:hypothetical protein
MRVGRITFNTAPTGPVDPSALLHVQRDTIMAKTKRRAAAPATPKTAATPATRRVPASRGQMKSERAGTAGRAIPIQGKIKVRATQMGYFDLKRRREGDVFYIRSASQFSKRWMEIVEGSLPLKQTGAQAALDRKHDEILGGTAARNEEDETHDDDGDGDDVEV